MSAFETSVKQISKLLGLTAAGQAAMAASLPVAIASDQAAVPVTVNAYTPVHKRVASAGGVLTDYEIWQDPGADSVYITDINVSTDAPTAITLKNYLASYEDTVVADGASHFWLMDAYSGNVIDRIGSLNLAAVGTPVYRTTMPGFGNAVGIDFDGATEGFGVTGVPASTTEWALEAWIYLHSRAGAYVIVGADIGSGPNTYAHMSTQAGGVLSLRVLNAGTAIVSVDTTTALEINTLYHVVFNQASGGTVTCFINGVSDTPVVNANTGNLSTVHASLANMEIGFRNKSTPSNFINGIVAAVAWYGTGANTVTEWLDHYNKGLLAASYGAVLWGPHYLAANSGRSED